MHAVIVGAGRVGAELAAALEDRGYTVSIIDQEEARFRERLHPGFHGNKIVGLGFDRDTLEQAGIKDADVFVSATRGDNTNVVSARIAKEHYRVANVAALIYDPRRVEIYERLGISTVASVAWSTDQILARVLPKSESVEWTVGSGEVVVVGMPVPGAWIGRPAAELDVAGKSRLVALGRFGKSLIPDKATTLQEGDFMHVSVLRSAMPDFDKLLAGDNTE